MLALSEPAFAGKTDGGERSPPSLSLGSSFGGHNVAGTGFGPVSPGYEPDELTITLPRYIYFFHIKDLKNLFESPILTQDLNKFNAKLIFPLR